MTLAAKSDDWEFDAKSSEISTLDFKKDMLARLVDSEQSADYPQIKKLIQQALKGKTKDIDGTYKMLEALGAVPDALTGRIYRVTGLDNVHGYKSKTAYVTVHNEGTDELAIGYLLCPMDTFSGNKYCEEKSLDKKGIFYDLYEPDKALW